MSFFTTGMIQRKSTFFLGIFILLLASSFLGLPTSWKNTLVFLSGLAIIFLSVKLTLPKKAPKRLPKKEKITPVFAENSPIVTTPTETSSNKENQAESPIPAENMSQTEVK